MPRLRRVLSLQGDPGDVDDRRGDALDPRRRPQAERQHREREDHGAGALRPGDLLQVRPARVHLAEERLRQHADQVRRGKGGGIGQLVFLEHPHAFTHPEWLLASIATLSALAGIGIGVAYWHGDARRAVAAREWAPDLHALLVNRYYMDNLYQAIINRVILGFAGVIAWFDKRIVNETGVDGGAQTVGYLGYRLKFLQTGRIPNYALGMAVGLVAIAVMAFSQMGE